MGVEDPGRSGARAGRNGPAVSRAARRVLDGVRSVGGCPSKRARGDQHGGRQKGGFTRAFAAEVAQEIDALIGADPIAALDLEAVEIAARRGVLEIAARAIEQRLNADRSDDLGPHATCPCGGQAHYAGRRAKTIETVLGPIRVDRAYYHCRACEHGWCPRDVALGVVDTTLSPGVTRMVGRVGAAVSFAEGQALLRELAAVSVTVKQVERTAEALGREIATDERTVVEAVATAERPTTLYLGLDGTGVPMRTTELVGRTGKQPDGSAKTREVKLCTVWSADQRAPDGTAVRDAGSITYSAAIETAAVSDRSRHLSAFAQRVQRETQRRGFDRAARRVALGDGAVWIWNLVDEQFPDAIQIVDRFHAKSHLSEVAKAIYGPTSDLGRQWASARHGELDAGQMDALLAAIDAHAATSDVARQCADYLRHNRPRMRYPLFHAAGLCTSSGVVEAGCKVTVGARLKRAGMHWTVRGANAILALRCCQLSGRFEDFWERRAERRVA